MQDSGSTTLSVHAFLAPTLEACVKSKIVPSIILSSSHLAQSIVQSLQAMGYEMGV